MFEVHQKKKKRVARVNSDVTRDGFSNGCYDLIDPIIKGMDYNISTKVQSNNFKTGRKVNEQNVSNFTPSTSKEYTQTLTKSKRFGLGRKFPLMEKTQRTLKHIKHNQSIPKQRAHLASLSASPIKRNNARNNSGMFAQDKSKNKQKINKNKSVSQDRSSGNVASVAIKNKNTFQNKSANFSTSESEEYSIMNCSKMSNVPCNKSINKNAKKRYNDKDTKNDNISNSTNVANNCDGDTTDSEYEKFIQNNKKRLSKRKQKTKSSTKASKKTKKNTVHSNVSKLNYSDSSSDTFSHKTRKTNRLTDSEDSEIDKKCSESDTSLMNYETYTRDSSSESDITNFEETVHDFTNSQLVEQKTNEKLTVETQSLNVINNLPNPDTSECVLDDGTLASSAKCVEQGNPSNISLMFDTAACENMSGDISVLSSKECNHSMTITQTNHEESDLEIIEVVPPKSKNRKVGADNSSHTHVNSDDTMNMNSNKVNCQSSVKTKVLQMCEIKDEKQQKQHNDEIYEAAYITDICNEELDSKVAISKQPPSDKNFSEVCIKLNCEVKKEDSDDDDIIIECIIPASNGKVTNTTSNNHVHGNKAQVKTEMPNSFVNNKTPNIKTENSFTNLIGTSKVGSSSCLNAKTFSGNENVSLKDLKLYEVACSNLAHTANLTDKMSDNFKTSVQPKEPAKQNENNIDIKHWVELFKKEFQVYQEICQTEANVEASLKLLETRQAEKLQTIRSLISNHLGNKQCDNSNINEQINLLYKTQKISDVETYPKAVSDIFLQKSTGIDDVFTSQKIMPPSSAVGKDEKPNLSLLDSLPLSIPYQHSLLKPKLEPISHNSSNAAEKNACRLLGEKCNLCGKEAVAACQRCAKVFFCSNECGKKYWEDQHEMECGK